MEWLIKSCVLCACLALTIAGGYLGTQQPLLLCQGREIWCISQEGPSMDPNMHFNALIQPPVLPGNEVMVPVAEIQQPVEWCPPDMQQPFTWWPGHELWGQANQAMVPSVQQPFLVHQEHSFWSHGNLDQGAWNPYLQFNCDVQQPLLQGQLAPYSNFMQYPQYPIFQQFGQGYGKGKGQNWGMWNTGIGKGQGWGMWNKGIGNGQGWGIGNGQGWGIGKGQGWGTQSTGAGTLQNLGTWNNGMWNTGNWNTNQALGFGSQFGNPSSGLICGWGCCWYQGQPLYPGIQGIVGGNKVAGKVQ